MRIPYRPLLFLVAAITLGATVASQSPSPQQALDSKETKIDQSSVTSLQLKIFHNDVEIGGATGFVLEKNDKRYLVTNRHVVLACAQDQNPTNIGGWICANKLAIYHNRLNHLGEWMWVVEDLFDERSNKRWSEHPTLGAAADLVALPLKHMDNVQFYPLDMELRKTDVVVGPADSVSIVGFPFGLAQQGGLPVWKTGTVASDLDINYRGKPIFLVDTTSRPGMSGSPVYAVRSGAFRGSDGMLHSAISGSMKRFLGVYSEQMQAAELGAVWKVEAVMALYDSLS
jgi:Trypsin-like peptidase domain